MSEYKCLHHAACRYFPWPYFVHSVGCAEANAAPVPESTHPKGQN